MYVKDLVKNLDQFNVSKKLIYMYEKDLVKILDQMKRYT
jgi:hypothetical protein